MGREGKGEREGGEERGMGRRDEEGGRGRRRRDEGGRVRIGPPVYTYFHSQGRYFSLVVYIGVAWYPGCIILELP